MKTLFLLPIIIIGTSLNLCAKNLKDVTKYDQKPIANAGPDKTIYLTQGSTVTLDGSASVGDLYQWTEVSTDYMSGGTITSPTSKTTTVTGLPQGVFYFKLTANSDGLTSEDNMKVIVDYDLPPQNSKLAWLFPIQETAFANLVNLRDDTIHHLGYNEGYNDYAHSRYYKNGKKYLFLERSRLNSMMIDSLRGKFRTILEDGYGWGDNANVEGASYARSQINIVNNGDFFIDSTKTFVFVWKIYFPQSVHDNMAADPDWGRVTMWDVHGNDDESGQFGITLSRDFMIASDRTGEIEGTGSATETKLINTVDLFNKTHTIKIIYREGSASSHKAFIRVEVDGEVKYLKTTGKVGKTLMQDYIKATGLYDYRRLLANPDNKTSGKKFSLVTMDANIYAINSKPTVNAGIDQTTASNSVSLSGLATDEGVSGNGIITSYRWTKLSGGQAIVTSPNAANTKITGLTTGVYIFELKATDDSGISGTDTIQVMVTGALNIPPASVAGSDQTITLPTNTVSLTGSGTDNDGTIISYSWTKISGPSEYKIVNPSSSITDVSDLKEGLYEFELKVTDDKGATAISTVKIKVNAANIILPIADAGPNKVVYLPVNKASLEGKGTVFEGTIKSYLWRKIDGPSGYKIVDTVSAVTDVTELIEGIYHFELKVTDDKGVSATSVVQVSVNAAANLSPTANAGADKSITLPANTVSLTGSGADKDGTISAYLWTKTAGPSAYNIVNPSSPVTDVSGLEQGIYQFALKVTDNSGATATSTVKVTVNAAANLSPTANAGADKSITLPANTVSLTGSGADKDGTISAYLWTKIAGPSAYNIVNPSSPVTDVSGLEQGIYQFALKVTDNSGATATSTVKVTVNAAANLSPTANAGADKSITLPANTVSLTGSGADKDGTISAYLWTKIAGPSAYNIVNPSSPVTDVSGLEQGIYQFALKVTDNSGATATSTVKVTVNAAANLSPTANAGADKSITLPANTVSLTGSGADKDGTISAYLWTKTAGPSAYNIVNPSSPVTDVSGLEQGIYQFALKVTDNSGATATSTVKVTVNAAANLSPTANAGADKSITLPANTVSLTGSGADKDGTISAYLWTKIAGPSAYNIVNPSSPVTDVLGLEQGIYQFALKVTDNSGATATSTVKVTVNAAANLSPTANAGADKSITLPANTVSLTGSGADKDGTISAYLWTKTAGPSAYNIVNPSSPVTDVSGLEQGIYQFALKVTDNSGATATSTVKVTVNAAANLSPTANAGADKSITLPANTVSLTGSGADKDGTISAYLWTKTAGPSAYNIVNPSSPVTDVSGLEQGIYQFALKVTDNSGATATSTVKVTVNAAANLSPTANAGADKSITLPANTVSLTGSGADKDGTISAYLWTKIAGPSAYNIVNPSSPVTDVSGLEQGIYQFALKVTDNSGATATSTVKVTVNAAANLSPTANAGADKSITLPANTVSLTGSGADKDGTISAYLWTKIAGPSAYNIVNPSSPVTDVSRLVQGIYQFELKVTDNKGTVAKDTVQVIVNAADNKTPTANAGSNKTITLPTNTTSLTGSGIDEDGTISSYAWTKIFGPSKYSIVNPSSPVTDISGLVQGVYRFELTVKDNKGYVGKDTVQVTVNAAANIAPTANAGTSKSIALPVNTVSLTGSGADQDGTISAYLWTKISGPSSFNIVNESSPVTDVSGLIQGVYQFELKVTDNKGATGTSTIQITVNAAANLSPTASAGTDKSITLPVNTTLLSGSGIDKDGKISSYLWTKISGPSAYNIVNPSSPVTNVSGMVRGVYEFELKVKDNKGATATSAVKVTVNPAKNIAPVANAGTNKTITLPTNTTSLAGSGTDEDGTISSYFWTKISGPSSYNIVNASSPVTDISGLVQGVYGFQLSVKDDKGNMGRDTVQVTVNAGHSTTVNSPNVAPMANAGNDTTVISPIDFITLRGSGIDADGKIASYLWNQISGPSASTILLNSLATTDVSSLVEGTYEFELTVTDNKGAKGKDTMKVTVALGRFARESITLKAYPNPVHDITTLEINSVKANTNLMIVISDMNGKNVYRKEFVSTLNTVKERINMSNLVKGTYVISVFFDGMKKQSVKVVRL